jgi:hypothetical protein
VFWYIDDVDREGNEWVNSHMYFGDGRKFEGAEHVKDLIIHTYIRASAINTQGTEY